MADAVFSCSQINEYFAIESGRFNIDVHERRMMSSPWARLIRRGAFPQQMGLQIKELTIGRSLSASLEDDWTPVSLSAGTSINPLSVPNPVDLQFSQNEVVWGLSTKAYRTPCISLDDLKFEFQIRTQVSKTIDMLTQMTEWTDSQRQMSALLSLCQVYPCKQGSIGGQGGYNPTATGLPATMSPNGIGQISQDILDDLYMYNTRIGAGDSQNALGMNEGTPVLGLICSSEASRTLIRNNPDLRQDLRFAKPSELVAPLGCKRDYGNYYHINISYPARFNYAGGQWIRVPVWMPVSSDTRGTDWFLNPAWQLATYEAATVFGTDIYECSIQKIAEFDIPNAPFDEYPYYYTGQPFWLNYKTDLNPLGKLGRWLLIFANGIRPIHPEYGATLIFRRCPYDATVTSCYNGYVQYGD